jgi:adenine-specific DNA-methyltransferase
MDKMRMESVDMTAQNIDKIGALFPNCITETVDESGNQKKVINFELLRQMLSTDVLEGDEVYEFTWVGKKAAIVEANNPIRKTLRPCKEDSVNWDNTENLYIEGDNLEVLKLLQESYLAKVKMIYIDPPYNTGNDFIYRDDFSQSSNEYLKQSGAVDEETGNRLFKNTDSNGRFHSDWCSMIYPRLMLARNLLTDDGLIFISIDENEVVNLRKICNEVFGTEQFIAQITLLCNPKGRSQDKYIANCHEYILIYSKKVLPSGSVSIPKSEQEIAKDYPLFDKEGKPYRELELRNTHRDFGRFNRQNLWYPLYAAADGSVSLAPDLNREAMTVLRDVGHGEKKKHNRILIFWLQKISEGKQKYIEKHMHMMKISFH